MVSDLFIRSHRVSKKKEKKKKSYLPEAFVFISSHKQMQRIQTGNK